MNSIRIRFPGGKAKAFTMSYDDGVQQDVRLIEIMRKNGVSGTFNLNSGCFAKEGTVYPAGQVHRRMSLSECKRAYAGEDIEVAVHTYTHPFLEQLPLSQCTMEVMLDREILEKEFGCIVRGMAYPYGTYSDDVVMCLKACDIVYSRTTKATHGFDMPSDWLRLGATCHHNDPQLMELADKFLEDDVRYGKAKLFYLWGHSYEFEGNDNWNVIEDFLAKVGNREDVWYATNIQVYSYNEAFKQLIFSADARTVYNPTSTDLWFFEDGVTYKIAAGETLKK